MIPRSRVASSCALVIISLALSGSVVLLAPGAFAAPGQETPSAQTDPAPGAPIHRLLSSGLRLIVVERPGSQLTALEVQVRVGSGSETDANNGLAHLCEHMVFKGTSSLMPGGIDSAIEGLGGELNARTGRNSTQFSTTVPSANWQKALGIAGDMLSNAAFRPEDLTAERKVIHAEMAWADCEPVRAGYSDVESVTLGASDSDRLPIMGSLENLDRFTSDDLKAFYRQWYRPENITVVVAGDVKADDVAAEVLKLFPISADRNAPAAAVPPVPRIALPGIVHAAPRMPGRLADRALTSVFLGFPIPMSDVRDQMPALDTLLNLLVVPDEPQGRLDAALVQKRDIAVSVTAEFVPGSINGLIVLSATGDPRYAQTLEDALTAEIHRLRDVPVVQDEVDYARFNAASNVNGGDGSLAGLAHRLANQDVMGLSHEMSDGYTALIGKVTAENVNKLIDKYLTPAHFAVADIGPAPKSAVAGGASR